MKRRVDPRILGWLGRALNHEMCAVQQYLAQSVLTRLQGNIALSDKLHHECLEELDHAARLMERLILDGVPPKTGNLGPAFIARDIEAMLQADQQLELDAVRLYESAIMHAQRTHDSVAEQLFAGLLKEEIAHSKELVRTGRSGTSGGGE